jgi:SAM-dependent methyltransferase
MGRDFSRRSTEPEWMDEAGWDFPTFEACLRDLAKVNAVTLARRPTLHFLETLRRRGRLDLGRPIEIVDVGSGYGDMLGAIARWARRHGLAVRLVGLDLNPWSAKAAADAWTEAATPYWLTQDVFDYRQGCDLAISSLFTHHLGDADVVRFLAWMEASARLGWFVNDLHRHPLPFHGFRVLAWAMRWHRFVRHDGPVSIARAFTVDDWGAYLSQAGLTEPDVELGWRFPFRICVTRSRAVPCQA